MSLDADDRALLEDVIDTVEELRRELRRLRTGELVARLSEADREEIARRVYERVDERLAPRELAQDEAPPRRRK